MTQRTENLITALINRARIIAEAIARFDPIAAAGYVETGIVIDGVMVWKIERPADEALGEYESGKTKPVEALCGVMNV